jgi:hypothetical protein
MILRYLEQIDLLIYSQRVSKIRLSIITRLPRFSELSFLPASAPRQVE